MKQPPPPESGGERAEAALSAYRELIAKYHRTLDLVSDAALRDLPRKIEEARAYADALGSLVPDGAVLDLGSGVGLPGIVVASVCPSRHVFLVERRRKRAAFLTIAVSHLGLDNAVVVHRDVRDFAEGDIEVEAGVRTVAAVMAQAVADLDDVYCLTRHLHDRTVVLLSRKGPEWRHEVERLRAIQNASPAVLRAASLGGSGTLVAVEARGGVPCPPSG